MTSAVLALVAGASTLGWGASVTLVGFDRSGREMNLQAFVSHIGRADRRGPLAVWISSPSGAAGRRARLKQSGAALTLSWDGLPRAVLSMPWPVADDGFSTVWIDREGRGFADGETIRLNEEIALTQYRLLREAWNRHLKAARPYEPSTRAMKLSDRARESMAKAQAAKEDAQRARLFDAATTDIALAWEKLMHEHGVQIAADAAAKSRLRFGLTLDESLIKRLDHYEDVVKAVRRSGADWVRLVFRPNPADFTYSRQSSFNEYDGIVKALRANGLRVMGCALDTAQWPSTLTPEIYAARVRNLGLQYKGAIASWEVGSEINGSWLGGAKNPLSTDAVLRIFSAGAAEIKRLDPASEVVATLYWWEGTAPDERFTLSGWLARHGPDLARHADVVGLSLQPEDNPVGMAFERIFERTGEALPDVPLMLSSFGYVEGDALRGFWWLHPDDVDGARKDLVLLYMAAACSMPRSLCGGFWWQTLDQMIPGKRKITDLYRVHHRALAELKN